MFDSDSIVICVFRLEFNFDKLLDFDWNLNKLAIVFPFAQVFDSDSISDFGFRVKFDNSYRKHKMISEILKQT